MLNQGLISLLKRMPKGLMWLFARRYIAGSSLEQALAVVQQLNQQGFRVTLDVLGESVSTLAETTWPAAEYEPVWLIAG
jgi:proline dehydrogenase